MTVIGSMPPLKVKAMSALLALSFMAEFQCHVSGKIKVAQSRAGCCEEVLIITAPTAKLSDSAE